MTDQPFTMNPDGTFHVHDLTKNAIPFGLLDKNSQKRLKEWPHGVEYFSHPSEWQRAASPNWTATTAIFRAVSATKRVVRWVNGEQAYSSYDTAFCYTPPGDPIFRIEYDEGTGKNPTIELVEDTE